MKYRRPLMLILLTGFALRLYGLGGQSLWYDETVSAVLAGKSIPDLIAHTARDIHPPGYYLLLHSWTRLAGETEFALALFSTVFGVLLIAAVFMFSRWKFNAHVGLWAAGLLALSPYNLWYSQEVRMYTLAAFLGVLAVYFVLRGRYLAYTLTATLGLYVLYYFAFLLIPLNLFLIGCIWKFRLRWQPWFIANLGIVLLYLPWIPTAWQQATNPPVPPWRSHIPLDTVLIESWTALSSGESVPASPGVVFVTFACRTVLLGACDI